MGWDGGGPDHGADLLWLQGAESGAPAHTPSPPHLPPVPSSSAEAAVLSTSSFSAALGDASPADLPHGRPKFLQP